MIPVAARVAVASILAALAAATVGGLTLTITLAVLAALWLAWALVDAAPRAEP